VRHKSISLLPVIMRELRAQSRQPLTYWLRIIGGLSLLAAIALAFLTARARENIQPGFPGLPTPNILRAFGTALFGKMNLLIFCAIWVFVPLAAADAVSRERREGTLALLYLTELRSAGIIVGKAFVHMLRSASLFLTMAPWLMLPVLFGGIEVRDIQMALLLNLTAMLLAMAAGLLASTFPRDWLKSVLLAEVLAVPLLLTMLYAHGAVLHHATAAGTATKPTTGRWVATFSWNLDYMRNDPRKIARTLRLLELTTNGSFRENEFYFRMFGFPGGIDSDWQQIWSGLAPAGHAAWFRGVFVMLAGAALVLLAAIAIGARRVTLSWQDMPQELANSEFKQRFLVPRFAVGTLDRRLSRALTVNPIGWLQHYSPSARLVKWAWCLFIIGVEIFFSAESEDLYSAQEGLGLLLLLGLTFSATGSFRKELENGAFELLLVTPLRERQLITGRVRGLWRQFLPAMLVYGAGGIYLASGWSDPGIARNAWMGLAATMLGFLTIPFIGLYFSLQRWNFFAAWMAACLLGLLPAALARAFSADPLSPALLQIVIAFSAAVLLRRRLQRREFLSKESNRSADS
jgi:ABC-type transport system involved in multi-copper enzyme maturation permease subunit